MCTPANAEADHKQDKHSARTLTHCCVSHATRMIDFCPMSVCLSLPLPSLCYCLPCVLCIVCVVCHSRIPCVHSMSRTRVSTRPCAANVYILIHVHVISHSSLASACARTCPCSCLHRSRMCTPVWTPSRAYLFHVVTCLESGSILSLSVSILY